MKRTILLTLAAMMITLAAAQTRTGFEKSLNVGYSVGVGDFKNDIISLSMIGGYRFNPTFFTGIGIGVGYSNALSSVQIANNVTSTTRMDAILIPVFANAKVNLTTDSRVSPFLSLNVGYTFDVNQYLKHAPGFMLQPNVGLDFQLADRGSMYFQIGFNMQNFDYHYMRDVGTAHAVIESRSELFNSIDLRIGFTF